MKSFLSMIGALVAVACFFGVGKMVGEGKKDQFAVVGTAGDRIEYKGDETGKVVRILELVGTPSGHVFRFAEVEISTQPGRTNTFSAFLHGADDLKTNEVVRVSRVNRATVAGGQDIWFVNKLK